MENKHPSVRDVVEYGLDRISPDRTVSVPVRELVRLFKSFEELNAFFHQPMHYPNMDAVHAFRSCTRSRRHSTSRLSARMSALSGRSGLSLSR
jgi:hypothetical protein